MKRIALLLGAAALVLAIVPSTALAASKPTQTIVGIATANGNFKTLLAAVGCADPAVGKAITSGKQLTVFAPTDAAFSAAGLTPANVCTALPKAKLTKILLYHVVSGDAYAKDVLPAAWGKINAVKTLLGQPVWAIHAAPHAHRRMTPVWLTAYTSISDRAGWRAVSTTRIQPGRSGTRIA